MLADLVVACPLSLIDTCQAQASYARNAIYDCRPALWSGAVHVIFNDRFAVARVLKVSYTRALQITRSLSKL